MNRRLFLQAATGAGLVMQRSFGAARLPIKKAILFDMLPKSMSIEDRFQLGRDCGFEEIECPTTPDREAAQQMLRASQKSKLRIHSVMNQEHWRSPLSSADAAVVAKSMDGMRTSLENAALWGADTVLLVPAVVNKETPYADAWKRSQEQIRRLIPEAEKRKVIIAVEEVWNKFLLSPLEFAKYVDDFQSPWVKAYFDVGNVALYGYPHDWIRTLGPRIVKLHIKDFRQQGVPNSSVGVTEWTNLMDGQIDWKEVHRALADIGYKGSATVEIRGGDETYLRDVNHRFEQILSGV
jgi:hexulose-6-phosphate isomerase